MFRRDFPRSKTRRLRYGCIQAGRRPASVRQRHLVRVLRGLVVVGSSPRRTTVVAAANVKRLLFGNDQHSEKASCLRPRENRADIRTAADLKWTLRPWRDPLRANTTRVAPCRPQLRAEDDGDDRCGVMILFNETAPADLDFGSRSQQYPVPVHILSVRYFGKLRGI